MNFNGLHVDYTILCSNDYHLFPAGYTFQGIFLVASLDPVNFDVMFNL